MLEQNKKMHQIHILISLLAILWIGGFTKAYANQIKPATPSGYYNVRDYGAKGDGHALDSPAINKAISAAAQKGGGTVYIPAGTYLSGSIEMKSNIRLYLEQRTVIQTVQDTSAYNPPEPNEFTDYQDFGHSHWKNSLIWGIGLKNISIEGQGMIYGKGLTRDLENRDNLPKGLGNTAIALKNCRNVILRDFSILKGGHFGILATGVDNFTIDNLTIDTKRDGIDVDACKNVRISNCNINSPWDDAIVLKSSHALGKVRNTENVTITNCYVTGGYKLGSLIHGTFKRFGPDEHIPYTGRIKFGTESNGGFKNITISNCVFEYCGGLALETVDGGDLEDVTISNITMRHIINMPIFLRLGSRMRGPADLKVGHLRHVNISNIVAYDAASRAASTISGIPGHDIEDVNISNVQLYLRGGGDKDMFDIQVPEKADGYPEPTMFGSLPAYGFFIRHVKGITMNNIQLHTIDADKRPAFYMDGVSEANFHRVDISSNAMINPLLLKDVNDFKLSSFGNLTDQEVDFVKHRTLYPEPGE